MCTVLDEIEARGIEIGEARGTAKGIEIGEARGTAKGIEIGEARGEERLSKLITILINNNDNNAIALVTSDAKARDEYYQKYNL